MLGTVRVLVILAVRSLVMLPVWTSASPALPPPQQTPQAGQVPAAVLAGSLNRGSEYIQLNGFPEEDLQLEEDSASYTSTVVSTNPPFVGKCFIRGGNPCIWKVMLTKGDMPTMCE